MATAVITQAAGNKGRMSAVGGKRTLRPPRSARMFAEKGRRVVQRVLGALIAIMGMANSAGGPREPVCPAPFGRLLGDAVFRAYPAEKSPPLRRIVLPATQTGRAHLYRTVIRDEARRGPDFAGHYTLVRIGCGAATVCVAIADAATGKVYFPANLKSATALLFYTGKVDVRPLNFRRNSRLLIVAGSPNEEERRAGLSYFEWRGERLRLVRFIRAAELCKRH